MSTDDYWDARWEYQEQAYQDELHEAEERYHDLLAINGWTEEDFSFEDFLRHE